MRTLIRLATRRVQRRSGPDLAVPSIAWGRCVIESGALIAQHTQASAIRATGVNYPGREHWAVIDYDPAADDVSEALVVDLTARQFRADAPLPWTGTLIDWYDDVVDWLGDHIEVEVYRYDPHQPQHISDTACWRDRYDSRDDVDPYRAQVQAAGLVTP